VVVGVVAVVLVVVVDSELCYVHFLIGSQNYFQTILSLCLVAFST
jgi:hypothetical protein